MTFSLSGLSQKKHGMIALEYFDGNQACFDTVEIKDGKFFFKGPLNEVSQAVLTILDSTTSVKNNKVKRVEKFYFILQPLHLTVKLDTTNVLPVVGGSPDQEDLQKLAIRKLEIVKESSLLYDQMLELIYKQQAGDTSESLDTEISNKSAALAASQERSMEKVLNLDKGFIKAHPASILSAFLIEEYRPFMPIDSVEILYNQLHKDIKNSVLGKQLQSRINAGMNSLLNKIAPDFTREDSEGKIVRLSDFTGHYVLLDFWASWCVPCRKITPEVIEIYHLYQSKLKVIYISLDSSKDEWKKAIKEDNIGGWVNLWENGKARQKENDLRFIYNIQPIPAFVLIDDKGRIIYRGQSTTAATEIKKILETNLK